MKKIIFYGADWCGDCLRSKRVLDNNKIEYEYIDLETDHSAAKKVTEINKGYQSIPTIIFPDGTILVEPPNEDLYDTLKKLQLVS